MLGSGWSGLTGVDGVEEICALLLLLDVCVDEQGVGLGVDILHHDLETVEAACLWYLDFTAEPLDEVLVNDAVGCGEKGEDVRYEVALVVVQSVVPIVEVFGEIDFFSGPKGGFCFLVHLPYLF